MKHATNAQINVVNILASKAGFTSAKEAAARYGYGLLTPGQLKQKQVKELTVSLERQIAESAPAP